MRKIPPYLMLDGWRGIAAVWVVMYHSCLPFLATQGNERFIHFPLYAISVWGKLGVTMFFVISGYCIMAAACGAMASGRSTASYGFDRVRRIFPPYLAATVFAICLIFAIWLAQTHHLLPPSAHPQDYSPWHRLKFWLANLLLLQSELGEPPLVWIAWSLCYEIAFYFLVGVLLILASTALRNPSGSTATNVFQIGIAGLNLLSLAWLLASPQTCPFPLDRWYQFGIGAQLFLVFAAEPGSPAWQARGHLILVGLLVFLFAVFHDGSYMLGQPSTRIQAAICLIFVSILWGLRPYDTILAHLRALRPLLWLGSISYSLYLIHAPVIAFPDVLGRKLGFDHGRYWVTYLVEIATAIMVG